VSPAHGGTAPALRGGASLRSALVWAGRIGLAGLFAYAGASKLGAGAELARDIANYHLVPESAAGWGALFLPLFELVLAAGLLLPSHARGAALLSALVLFAFAAAMAQAKLRGIDLACGCFGGESQVSWGKVAVDLALAGLALWLVGGSAPRAAPPVSVDGAAPALRGGAASDASGGSSV
jgi:putative oxidoreductase